MSDLFERVVHAAAKATYEYSVQMGMLGPAAADWEHLDPAFKHRVLEGTTTPLTAAWPLVSEALQRAATDESGLIMRARIEMFIAELQGRGPGMNRTIAAELQTIIDAPLEG